MITETPNNPVKTTKIAVGYAAPDLTLTNTKGENVQLSSLWNRKPLILLFLRHYGCAFCKQQVIQLRADYEVIRAAGADVVCVAMGPYKAGRAFQIVMELPFEILTTGEGVEAFRAYGLNRATLLQLLSPTLWWRVLLLLFQGVMNNPLEAQGDLGQMSGAFVVGTDGNFVHVDPAKVVYEVVATKDLLANLPTVPAIPA